MVACTLDYDWPTYVVASLISMFGGLFVMLIVRYVYRCWSVTTDRLHRCHKHLLNVQEAADTILSGDSFVSKAFIFGLWIVDVASIVVFLIEGTLSNPLQKAVCGSVRDDRLQHIWITLMCMSAAGFLIKLCAAADKVRVWIELESVAEHFTVVPTFVSIYYDRNWLGFRFLRVLHLLRASDVLQLLKMVKNRTAIHLTWAASVVAIVWTCGACVFYMLETNGDPWENYPDVRDAEFVRYFWEYFYFVLVMLTTIGFGDIFPVTTLAKLFLVFYVLFCLAAFGKLLPQLAEIFNNRSRFREPYRQTYRRHLVICGGLTFETMKSLVKNFVYHDWAETSVGMVVINRTKPSLKLQAFFRRHFNNVTFVEGTVLDVSTLRLAKVKRASAVLILANRGAVNEDEEDAANIMRATAVKNFKEDTRVIIQLLQYRNKERLLHIPSWSWHSGKNSDEVICISELKMSIMAQNCLAPGVVTLLANLITPHRVKRKRVTGSWQGMEDYLFGFEHVIYTEKMSDAFVGMTFTAAVEICYRELDMVLIAVDCRQVDGWTKLCVNPADTYCIQADQVGYFIAKTHSHVRRVAEFKPQHYYCNTVEHSERPANRSTGDLMNVNDNGLWPHPMNCSTQLRFARQPSGVSQSTDESDANNNNDVVETVIDPTGMYYWCPPRSLDKVLLDYDSVREYNLANHIIFILGAPSATLTRGAGLRNFMLPLRASSIRLEDIKTVIFCVSRRFIEREWSTVASFPKVFVFARTESLYSDLRALNMRKCSMCIVMETNELPSIDDKLVDTSTIHTTNSIHSLLNISSRFAGSNTRRRPTLLPQVSWSIQEAHSQMLHEEEVQMLVELEYDDSVAYIDYDDEEYSSQPIFQTPPYVCGRVLLASVLDSLVTMAYMNSNLMHLFRALITSGELTDLENALGDGLGVFRRHALADVTSARNRSTLTLLSLNEYPLEQVQHGSVYGRLVVECLQSSGILCIGLYRLQPVSVRPKSDQSDTYQHNDTTQRRQKRYVITNPPSTFELSPTDKVYALKPFEFQGRPVSLSRLTRSEEQQTTAARHIPVQALVTGISNGETGV